MRSRQNSSEEHFSWRRLATILVPSMGAAAILVAATATGALAANFATSNHTFKVSASALDGTGFSQYGGIDQSQNGNPHPLTVSVIDSATLTNMCQSVVADLSKLGLPNAVLRITAGTASGNPVKARNLVVDADSLSGDATFTNFKGGIDAGSIGGTSGEYGQTADSVHIANLKQQAWATTAGTFKLTGLSLHVGFAGSVNECF